MGYMTTSHRWIGAIFLAGLLALSGTALARSLPSYAAQVLYLPIYSHLYHGDLDAQGRPQKTLLSVHVSIRNMNLGSPVKVLYANYYDTAGRLIKNYLPEAVVIPPLGTHELFIPRSDTSGGSGANFIIAWEADSSINPPRVEAVHADVQPSRTLTFVTEGLPIHPKK